MRKRVKNEEFFARILDDNANFETCEAYKTIRTNIMFSMPKSERGKVIVIAGSVAGEGKTTTAINLAITFAQTGAKVLIVDCDLRKSRVHRYLGIANDEGVTNVLCGFCGIEDAIVKNVRENLDCLTSGGTPPNPSELLESEEYEKMINSLKEKYDYIFIDTPPTTVVTDAAITFKQSSGIVVIVRQHITKFEFLDTTVETAKKANAKILGFVMLGCTDKTHKHYGKGKYGYAKYSYSNVK